MISPRTHLAAALVLVSSLSLLACGKGVSSEETAQLAYLGLNKAIEKSLKLGFDGFNAASSANIPNQSTTGDASGTLTISGKVDQGVSANKNMQLRMGLVGYSDGPVELEDEGEFEITYATAEAVADQPALDLSLKNIPNGTFTGSLVGTFDMTGEIEDTATVNLNFAGEIEDNGAGGTRRKQGTTAVTGTVTSKSGGAYGVNLSI
jgi:hypothetical protein